MGGSAVALAFFLLLPFPSFSGAAQSPKLRIGLLTGQTSITVGPGAYRLSGKVTRTAIVWKKPARIMVNQKGLMVGKERWGKSVAIASAAPGGVVMLNNKPYRGRVELERDGPNFRVVNHLTVEDYVRGVLQMETSDKWPEQALRAQAVISRTYALRNRGRHGKGGFDFCRTPHCQAYGGAGAERTTTDAAVNYTRGQVLLDKKGRLISTVFHSTCGGETESAENVWERGGQPYLRPVRCPWCKKSPHYRWTAKVPNVLVTKNLAEAKANVGTIRHIGILSQTPSGRVYRVRVYGTTGEKDYKANHFRNIVDPRLIRSTLWEGISRRGDNWQFHGRGWGHGVGLCQWGMKTLADQSMTYGQILRMYYRGISVQDWTE